MTAATAPSSDGHTCPLVDICVVGGGLGGLALAIGLERLGLDWTLCEAAPELRTATGTLIGLGDNGLVALEAICPQIVEALRQEAMLSIQTEAHYRPTDPGCDASVTVNQLTPPLHTIRWAATQNVLAALVNHSRVRCSHRCLGWSQEEGQDFVTVRFKDQPDIRARMVVGADGVRSVVRAGMAPDDPGPRFLGYIDWNSVRHVPGSSSAPGANTIRVVTDSRPRSHNFVMMINAGQDYVFWMLRCAVPAPEYTQPGRARAGGVPGSKARVLRRLQELGWDDVAKEVEDTEEAAIYERALWDRLPLESWSSAGGRVVLLGDAAHSMYPGPGQGARTAFEDAHQLFLALKQHGPDAAATAQYEEARVMRASAVQNYAAAMANMHDELSARYAEFWAQQEGGDDPPARYREFQAWLNSYPEHTHGVPGSRFTSPEALRAFNEHCASASSQHQALYQQQAAPGAAEGCARVTD